MKKSDVFIAFIVALIVSFSFLGMQTQTNKAIGQTTSSSSSGLTTSSSSSGSTTSSSSSGSTTSSSSSGSTSSSSGSIGVTSTSSGSQPAACTPEQIRTCLISSPICASGASPVVVEGRCCASCVKSPETPQTSTSSSGSSTTSSSSGGSDSATLNQNFTGIWKAELPKPKQSSSSSGNVEAQVASSSGNPTEHPEGSRGSRIITFKLCVKDGKLEGSVEQGGVLMMGLITSQTVISADEITINVEDKRGNKATLTLKLTGEREFTGTFADGRTFKARKLNPFKACNVNPSESEGMSSMSGTEGEHGMSSPGPEGMSSMSGTEGEHGMSGPGPEGMSSMSGTEDEHGMSGPGPEGMSSMSGPEGEHGMSGPGPEGMGHGMMQVSSSGSTSSSSGGHGGHHGHSGGSHGHGHGGHHGHGM